MSDPLPSMPTPPSGGKWQVGVDHATKVLTVTLTQTGKAGVSMEQLLPALDADLVTNVAVNMANQIMTTVTLASTLQGNLGSTVTVTVT